MDKRQTSEVRRNGTAAAKSANPEDGPLAERKIGAEFCNVYFTAILP
jgi:hypothetical protein